MVIYVSIRRNFDSFVSGMSLLERLMEHNPLYQKNSNTGKYDSQYLTKLIQNYRSHKYILDVPNKCFYDNELQVNISAMLIM